MEGRAKVILQCFSRAASADRGDLLYKDKPELIVS